MHRDFGLTRFYSTFGSLMEWRGMIIVDNEIPRECQIAYFLCTFGTVMDVISRIGLARALYMPDKPNLIYD